MMRSIGRGAPRGVVGIATLVLVATGIGGAAYQPVAAHVKAGKVATIAEPVRGGPFAPTDSATPVNPNLYELCQNPQIYPTPSSPFQAASSYVAGYSNAAKLKGSLPVGFPVAALAAGTPPAGGVTPLGDITYDNDLYGCFWARLQLDYRGQREFPPARATFLAFGVMPVTATAYLTQVGPDPVTAVIYQNQSNLLGQNAPYTVVSVSHVTLRIGEVTVNGKPLNVGTDCHTVSPLSSPGNPLRLKNGLVLSGGSFPGDATPLYTGIQNGGALAGSAAIPPFTDCGINGDLDPLITASVSGSGDYVKVVQGPVCEQAAFPLNCVGPENIPSSQPYWTVTGGGTFSAHGPAMFSFQLTRRTQTVISCDSAIAGTVPDASGPSRADLGALTWNFSSCTGPGGSQWTVTQQGSLPADAATYTAGSTTVGVSNVSLTLSGTNVPGGTGPVNCAITVQGSLEMDYTNPPNPTLSVDPGTVSTMVISADSCPGSVISGTNGPTIVSSAPVQPGTITITSPAP
jgi:hypothetical protein